MSAQSFTVNTIGHIRCGSSGFSLEIADSHRAALAELQDFSHINVLWWCDQLDQPFFREMTIADQPYKRGPAVVGIFATRSPIRPNPIALTVSQVISVDTESGVVQLAYIDAEDGTPVLDIKPYLPATDRVRDTATPSWCSDWPQWYEDSATFDWEAVFENAQ